MSELATIGGGCYWCFEAFYKLVKGVIDIDSGYTGGHIANPSAERVYQGDTGHTEAVQLTFDPSVIGYKEILRNYFVMHDPTTLNRQGYDVGEWYRSAIFYHDDKQKEIAEDMKLGFATELWPNPIVTEITKFEKFWPAEAYMQDYYERNPSQAYCQMVIDPKIQKLRQEFAKKLIV